MPNPQSGKKRLGKKHRQAATRPHKGTGVAAGKRGESKSKAEARGKGRVAAKAVAKKKAGKNAKGGPTVDKPQVSMKRTAFSKDRVGPTDWRLEDAAVEAAAPNERLQHATHAALGLLPLIAICGRPNVGKSTLFNRLTRTRRSIVGDEPGITRDRIYGLVEWSGQRARIVDTGGVVPDDDELIPSEIYRQARVALHEADAIVMVVDGRTELASPDIELARLLQRSGKPVFLAVNKMDAEQMEVQAQNFRRLGLKEVLPISAEHGSGIGDLLDTLFAVLPKVVIPVEEEPEEEVLEDEEIERLETGVVEDSEQKLRTHGEYDQHETKIAIIGRPNVGKSTLLNALTGTSRAIVSPVAGTTRDAVDEVVERDNALYRFVDTAGIRRKGKTKLMAEKLSVVMARKHLEAADVSLLVIDAVEGVTALDANIGGYAHESGRSVVIVVNKWDLVTGGRTDGKPPAEREIFEEQVRDSLKYLEYAPMVFVTAIKGKNIDKVFEQVQLVARERRKRITTGQMNRFLEKVDFERASVPVSKRVRIFYMTQAAVAPPTFILFTDRDVKLHFSYERFLANQIRKEFGFVGSPIWFKVRARTKKN